MNKSQQLGHAPQQHFQWTGVNSHGQLVKGTIESTHLVLAKQQLQTQGMRIKTISRQRNRLIFGRKKIITNANIAQFSRELAIITHAGIPLIQALRLLTQEQSNPAFQSLLLHIKHDITTGKSLAEALAAHPHYFNALYCQLVAAGERAGALDEMLQLIANHLETMQTLKKQLQKTLRYPLIVVSLAGVVTIFLLLFVVPQFQSLFETFNAKLPFLTRLLIQCSELLQTHLLAITTGLLAMIFLCKYQLSQNEKFLQFIHHQALHLPLIGPLLTHVCVGRFCRTLAITFNAGLPIVEALKTVSGTTGNRLYYHAINTLSQQVAMGQSLQESLGQTTLFPKRLIHMIALGEESGQLDLMLSHAADFYEAEADHTVEQLGSLLEPCIMLILGALVGTVIIAMYLPIFKLGAIL